MPEDIELDELQKDFYLTLRSLVPDEHLPLAIQLINTAIRSSLITALKDSDQVPPMSYIERGVATREHMKNQGIKSIDQFHEGVLIGVKLAQQCIAEFTDATFPDDSDFVEHAQVIRELTDGIQRQ